MQEKTLPLIALIGANGKIGSVILKQFLERGWCVNALYRNPDRIVIPRFDRHRPLVGDAADPETVARLTEGCAIVINAASNTNNRRPVSSLITANVLAALRARPGVRYFVMTGKTVRVRGDRRSPTAWLQRLVLKIFFGGIVRDKDREAEILRQSAGEWTLVRCPLAVAADMDEFQVSTKRCAGPAVSPAAVARFIREEIDNKKYVRKAPFVFCH